MKRYHKHLEATLAGYTVRHESINIHTPWPRLGGSLITSLNWAAYAPDTEHCVGWYGNEGEAWFNAWRHLQFTLGDPRYHFPSRGGTGPLLYGGRVFGGRVTGRLPISGPTLHGVKAESYNRLKRRLGSAT